MMTDEFTDDTRLEATTNSLPGLEDVATVDTYAAEMLDWSVYFVLRPVVAIAGSVANVVNMIVFYKLGIHDSMSVGLFSLSLSDLLVTLLSAYGVFSYIVSKLDSRSIFDAYSIFYVVSWGTDIFFVTSCWITTVLSIERCACVVLPFEIKAIFSLRRSLVAILLLLALSIAAHYPAYGALWWFEWAEESETNSNSTMWRLVLVESTGRTELEWNLLIMSAVILLIPPQMIVCVSTVWMVYGLAKSSEIRQTIYTNEGRGRTPASADKSAPAPSSSKNENENVRQQDGAKANAIKGNHFLSLANILLKLKTIRVTQNSKQAKLKSKLSKRERKLAKTIILLVTFMSVSNLPRCLVTFGESMLPEISVRQDYGTIFTALAFFIDFLGLLCSSINIFVYLTLNRNFRMVLKQFCVGKVSTVSTR